MFSNTLPLQAAHGSTLLLYVVPWGVWRHSRIPGCDCGSVRGDAASCESVRGDAYDSEGDDVDAASCSQWARGCSRAYGSSGRYQGALESM